MNKKYFQIDIKTNHFSSEFELVESDDSVIAVDYSGNNIVLMNEKVYLYIHDAINNKEYIELYSTIDEFKKQTFFYDEEYRELLFKDSTKDIVCSDDIPDKLILLSKFVNILGGSRIINKYKEGSHYNIKSAYIDGTITKEEFDSMKFL